MNAQILLITGGPDVESYVYREYGFGYWSSAFSMILEKYGILSFDVTTREVLSRPESLASYQAVFIGWIPEKFWDSAYEETIERYKGVLVWEKPAENASVHSSLTVKTEGLDILLDDRAPKTRPPRYAENDTPNCVGITEKCQRAWLRPPLLCTHDTTILEWQDNRLIVAFPVFSYMVYAHTVPPMIDHFFDITIRPALDLITGFFDLVEKRISLVKTAPWPDSADYALTLRHDYDRPVSEDAFIRLTELHMKYDLGVSWYWISGREDPVRIKQLSGKHENALHTLSDSGKQAEIAQLGIKDLYGETWHGTGKHYWNSCYSIETAKNCGLSYTEFLPAAWDFPSAAYPCLKEDGRISLITDIVGITFNATVDTPKNHRLHVARKHEAATTPEKMRERAQKGEYLNLLNHPDINFDHLAAAIKTLPENRVDMTAAAVAWWWAATHCRQNLDIQLDGKTLQITARMDVKGVVVLHGPSRFVCDLEAGATLSLAPDTGKNIQISR